MNDRVEMKMFFNLATARVPSLNTCRRKPFLLVYGLLTYVREVIYRVSLSGYLIRGHVDERSSRSSHFRHYHRIQKGVE